MMLRVLIGCEASGAVRRAFRDRGHDAWSCDIQPSDDDSPHHITGDVRPLLRERWDLAIMHPECTYLTGAGVRWLYQGGKRYNADGTENPIEPVRWAKMEAACAFYIECWNVNATFVAVENSKMHGHALERLAAGGVPVKSAYVVQPWWFAHSEDDVNNVTKGAHLITRNLPRLVRTGTMDGSTARDECHRMAPGPLRSKMRSETKPGIADAIATQWGDAVASVIGARAA